MKLWFIEIESELFQMCKKEKNRACVTIEKVTSIKLMWPYLWKNVFSQ